MKGYGFNFETLYHLELPTLYDIVHIMRANDAMIAPDQDVMIRGCIVPFLRGAARAPEGADKDEVLRGSLIVTAKKIGVTFKNWEDVHTDTIASAAQRRIRELLAERLEQLDPDERAELLGVAQDNVKDAARTMGVPLAGAGAILAGELSGFGIYLATTTGLHALSLGLGTTFGFGVYQGATALLGIVLGPVGWVLSGGVLITGASAAVLKWVKGKRDRKLVLTVVALLLAIGENPFTFLGLTSDATFEQMRMVYRAMMKTFHPDTLERSLPPWVYDDFNEKLLRCQEAYQKLERILGPSEEGEQRSE